MTEARLPALIAPQPLYQRSIISGLITRNVEVAAYLRMHIHTHNTLPIHTNYEYKCKNRFFLMIQGR